MTIVKGHNIVVNMRKQTCNDPNLGLVMVNVYAKLGKIRSIVHKIFSGNESFTINKGHNCVVDLQKLTHNNPNLDLVNVNAYAKFGLIASIRFQDIERKQNSDANQGP